jgi:hypothetical protein
MTVSFRIDKVTISNFRGIRELEVAIPDDIPSILVGSNNACKSTVLNAIALGLRGGGFHQWTPGEFDFFHPDPGQPAPEFSIVLHFEALAGGNLPAVQAMGNPILFTASLSSARPTRPGGCRIGTTFSMSSENQSCLCRAHH